MFGVETDNAMGVGHSVLVVLIVFCFKHDTSEMGVRISWDEVGVSYPLVSRV